MATPVALHAGDVSIVVDPDLGGRAISWTIDGLSILASRGTDPVEFGMYPMAPWAGRLRNNAVRSDDGEHVLPATYDGWALHGTVLSTPMTVTDHYRDDAGAVVLACSSKVQDWPWSAEVEVVWRLSARELITSITVLSQQRPFPVVSGWHPWFARQLPQGAPAVWTIRGGAWALRGADNLPSGNFTDFDAAAGPYDDAFLVPDGVVRVRWPGAVALDIVNEGPWFVVYDQLPHVLCIEPQSGPPNGVNDGLGHPISQAAPGHPHVLTTRWLIADDARAGPG